MVTPKQLARVAEFLADLTETAEKYGISLQSHTEMFLEDLTGETSDLSQLARVAWKDGSYVLEEPYR